MRLGRAMVVVLVAILVGGCASPNPPAPTSTLRAAADSVQAGPSASAGVAASPGASGEHSTPPAPIDTAALLGSDEVLAVPDDASKAAAYLVAQVRVPATARAAVREILLRSGIGIFRADTGALAAVPADPSLVDAYVYEFEVPVLADAVGHGASTSSAPLLDLLAGGGLIPDTATEAQVEQLVRAWVDESTADPGAPLAFAGLAVSELIKADAVAWAAPDDTPGGAAPSGGPGGATPGASPGGAAPSGLRLDPLALELAMAALASGRGHISGQAMAAPEAILAVSREVGPGARSGLSDDECDEPAKSYDSGLMDKFLKDVWKDVAGKVFGSGAAKAGARVDDYGKMLSTVQARAALLSGMTITVSSDATGTPHYRHSTGDGGGSSVWQFTATAAFNTALGGRIVNCGALAGLRIPENGGIEGLRLQWAISDNIECTERGGNCNSLGRIPSGGGGATTDADGKSRLQVETIVEEGCPSPQNGMQTDKSKCNTGPVVNGTASATVTPDLTTQPPLKLADLLFKPSSLGESTAKALAKVLIDIATDIAANASSATGRQAVTYHKVADYKVAMSAGGVTWSGTKCGSYVGDWTIKISGHPDASTTVTGSAVFTLDEDGRGKATVHFVSSVKVTVGGTTIRAQVVVDATADVELLNPGGSPSLQFTHIVGHGEGSGSGPGASLRMGFPGGRSDGSAAMPVQQGTFCSKP